MILKHSCLHFMKRLATGKRSGITIHKHFFSYSSTGGQNHGMLIVTKKDCNLPAITGNMNGRICALVEIIWRCMPGTRYRESICFSTSGTIPQQGPSLEMSGQLRNWQVLQTR